VLTLFADVDGACLDCLMGGFELEGAKMGL
jgi:hypothetical protein